MMSGILALVHQYSGFPTCDGIDGEDYFAGFREIVRDDGRSIEGIGGVLGK
jgi:hypothetical protein